MVQGPVAYGAKIENRLKVKRGLKSTIGAGIMTTKTRVGRETALAANADIKHQRDNGVQVGVCATFVQFWRLLYAIYAPLPAPTLLPVLVFFQET